MKEIVATLQEYADDAQVEIVSFDQDGLRLRVEFPSRGGEKWDLVARDVVHLDMSPSFILGDTLFGDLGLLSQDYIDSRNFDYGGDPSRYRVIKFRDIDEKLNILVVYGTVEFIKSQNTQQIIEPDLYP